MKLYDINEIAGPQLPRGVPEQHGSWPEILAYFSVEKDGVVGLSMDKLFANYKVVNVELNTVDPPTKQE